MATAEISTLIPQMIRRLGQGPKGGILGSPKVSKNLLSQWLNFNPFGLHVESREKKVQASISGSIGQVRKGCDGYLITISSMVYLPTFWLKSNCKCR